MCIVIIYYRNCSSSRQILSSLTFTFIEKSIEKGIYDKIQRQIQKCITIYIRIYTLLTLLHTSNGNASTRLFAHFINSDIKHTSSEPFKEGAREKQREKNDTFVIKRRHLKVIKCFQIQNWLWCEFFSLVFFVFLVYLFHLAICIRWITITKLLFEFLYVELSCLYLPFSEKDSIFSIHSEMNWKHQQFI